MHEPILPAATTTGRSGGWILRPMTAADVDAYLAPLPDDQRAALEDLRSRLRALLPDAEECISYRMPAFRLGGKVVAGYAAFAKHLAYLPHSGDVLGRLDPADLTPGSTKSSLHFTPAAPLSDDLVARLVELRCAEAGVG